MQNYIQTKETQIIQNLLKMNRNSIVNFDCFSEQIQFSYTHFKTFTLHL